MPTTECTSEIAVASIALIVAATALVNVMIAYYQSRRLASTIKSSLKR